MSLNAALDNTAPANAPALPAVAGRLPAPTQLTLTLRGVARTVMFDHANKGFVAAPIWKLLDGEITPELLYLPTLRFLEI